MRTWSRGNCSQSQPARCCVAGKQKAWVLFPVLWTWTPKKKLKHSMSGIRVGAHLKIQQPWLTKFLITLDSERFTQLRNPLFVGPAVPLCLCFGAYGQLRIKLPELHRLRSSP